MKNKVLRACALAFLCILLASSAQAAALPATMTLSEGESVALTGEWGEDAVFASASSKVATVSDQGVVTGVKAGYTTLTAQSGGETAKCRVTVKKTTLTLRAPSKIAYIGHEMQLSYDLSPASSALKATWTSGGKTVATVSETGVVTPLRAGYVTITATLPTGTRASVTLQVKKPGLTLKNKSLSLYEGFTATLTPAFQPADSAYTNVKWTSSAPSVASVDENGIVTAKKYGYAAITGKLENGSSVRCAVTVKATTVKLNMARVTLYEGGTQALSAVASPAGGLYGAVTYASSAPKVATVDASGVITAVKTGYATITAKMDNGRAATCFVTVKKTGVKLSKTSLALKQGEQYALTAAITPADGLYRTASFASSNPKVATVDETGLITALNYGVTYVSATLENGAKASCAVSVSRATIAFTKGVEYAYLGCETALSPTVRPEKGLYSGITWSSSNPEIVRVDEKGNVFGVAMGKAYVTAKLDAGAKATVTVTVRLPGVKLDKTSAVLFPDETLDLNAREWPATGAQVVMKGESSNDSVAYVNQDGEVVPVKAGKATITFTHPNGSTAKCQVTVKNYAVTGVTLGQTQATLGAGEELQLTATVVHALAPDKRVTWTSSNQSVAKVSKDGLVTPAGSGACVITATTKSGYKKATCKVTVNLPKYRALTIGEFTTYGMNKAMAFAANGVNAVSRTLRLSKAYGQKYAVTMNYQNPGKAKIASMIAAAFKGADDNDVSFLYLNTHGVSYNGAFYLALPGWYENEGDARYSIGSAELMGYLQGVKGHVVIVVNACNSGGLINELFTASDVLNALSASAASGSRTVICSSQWGVASSWYRNGTEKIDFLAWGITRALGYDIRTGRSFAKLYGDENGDGLVTAGELARYSASYVAYLVSQYVDTPNYVGNRITPQEVRYYVTDPNVVIFGR